MNRQRFSMLIGLAIFLGHFVCTGYIILIFSPVFEEVELQNISLPLTTAYLAAIVIWFFDNKGLVTSEDRYGMPLVLLVSIIVGAMFLGMFGLMYTYAHDTSRTMTPEKLEDYFLYLEMAFGGTFGIVVKNMFGES